MKNTYNYYFCGFPGVGKTTAASDRESVIDLETTPFHWDANGNEVKDWVKKYFESIDDIEQKETNKTVLLSTHKSVITGMRVREIPFVVVAPKREDKNGYLIRYIRRGSTMSFILKMNEKWYEYMDDIDTLEKQGVCVVRLNGYEGISDIIPLR